MNVSNEQAKDILLCVSDDKDCKDCSFNHLCRSHNKGTEMVIDDLLEARELIKEINKTLTSLFISFAKNIPTPCDIELRSLIEKSKDYV